MVFLRKTIKNKLKTNDKPYMFNKKAINQWKTMVFHMKTRKNNKTNGKQYIFNKQINKTHETQWFF